MLISKRTGSLLLELLLTIAVILGFLILDKPSTPPIVNQNEEVLPPFNGFSI
jgi:hypothetical protein